MSYLKIFAIKYMYIKNVHETEKWSQLVIKEKNSCQDQDLNPAFLLYTQVAIH